MKQANHKQPNYGHHKHHDQYQPERLSQVRLKKEVKNTNQQEYLECKGEDSEKREIKKGYRGQQEPGKYQWRHYIQSQYLFHKHDITGKYTAKTCWLACSEISPGSHFC